MSRPPAGRPGGRGERGPVGDGDRADDGQAQSVASATSVAVAVPDPLVAQLLEGLEEAVQFLGGTRIPVLVIRMVARPSVIVVQTWIRPGGAGRRWPSRSAHT